MPVNKSVVGTLLGLVFSLALVSADAAGTPEQDLVAVRVSGSSVYLTCPSSTATSSVLMKDGVTITNRMDGGSEYHLQGYSDSNDGEYHCKAGDRGPIIRRLYLKVKVCDTCVDLAFWTVAGIIVGDILVTVGVVILVYYCSKRRKGSLNAGAAAGRHAKDHTKDRPPPVPNPDYEPIRKGQREVYDGLKPIH